MKVRLAAVLFCLAGTTIPMPAAELPVTGSRRPALASFDRLMRSFLSEQDVPGAALAVGRKGRVVYARGFLRWC